MQRGAEWCSWAAGARRRARATGKGGGAAGRRPDRLLGRRYRRPPVVAGTRRRAQGTPDHHNWFAAPRHHARGSRRGGTPRRLPDRVPAARTWEPFARRSGDAGRPPTDMAVAVDRAGSDRDTACLGSPRGGAQPLGPVRLPSPQGGTLPAAREPGCGPHGPGRDRARAARRSHLCRLLTGPAYRVPSDDAHRITVWRAISTSVPSWHHLDRFVSFTTGTGYVTSPVRGRRGEDGVPVRQTVPSSACASVRHRGESGA